MILVDTHGSWSNKGNELFGSCFRWGCQLGCQKQLYDCTELPVKEVVIKDGEL